MFSLNKVDENQSFIRNLKKIRKKKRKVCKGLYESWVDSRGYIIIEPKFDLKLIVGGRLKQWGWGRGKRERKRKKRKR